MDLIGLHSPALPSRTGLLLVFAARTVAGGARVNLSGLSLPGAGVAWVERFYLKYLPFRTQAKPTITNAGLHGLNLLSLRSSKNIKMVNKHEVRRSR
jgi:hypothetical protein